MNKKLHVWSRHLRGKPKKLKSFLTGYLAAILYFPGKVEALLISAHTNYLYVCSSVVWKANVVKRSAILFLLSSVIDH